MSLDIIEFLVMMLMYVLLTYSCIIQYGELNNGRVFGGALLYVVLMIIIIFRVSYHYSKGVQDTRKEAIEKGHAEYIVNTKGETVFSWK